jgi:hypothetical protein
MYQSKTYRKVHWWTRSQQKAPGSRMITGYFAAWARKGVGGHLRSNACREVRSASCAAMAVAPSGTRLLELQTEKGGCFSYWRKCTGKYSKHS